MLFSFPFLLYIPKAVVKPNTEQLIVSNASFPAGLGLSPTGCSLLSVLLISLTPLYSQLIITEMYMGCSTRVR